MATRHKMALGGHPLMVNPEEVRWNFKMKVADTAAMGGKVIQIIGLSMSDITVRGRYSPDKSKGDTESWEAGMRFREWVKVVAKDNASSGGANTTRFTYPPRGWDFDVHIKSISAVKIEVGATAMEWDLTLVPVGSAATEVVKGIKDLYIKRLMDGVGWKQTDYNGPMTQAIVDEQLGGQSAQGLYETELGESFLAGAGSSTASLEGP